MAVSQIQSVLCFSMVNANLSRMSSKNPSTSIKAALKSSYRKPSTIAKKPVKKENPSLIGRRK